jgi:hypothetical protein
VRDDNNFGAIPPQKRPEAGAKLRLSAHKGMRNNTEEIPKRFPSVVKRS